MKCGILMATVVLGEVKSLLQLGDGPFPRVYNIVLRVVSVADVDTFKCNHKGVIGAAGQGKKRYIVP